MKKLKINFTDMWGGFNPHNNLFTSFLQKEYEIEISDNPDFLIYSCFGSRHVTFSNCVKIFYAYENVFPNFSECDYSLTLIDLQCQNRHLRLTEPIYKPQFTEKDREWLTKRKFCNFISSRLAPGSEDIYDGTSLRPEFVTKLSSYKKVDCPGKVCNNMKDAIEPLEFGSGRDWRSAKYDFLKKYKFTLAIENTAMPGYISEKLYDPIRIGSVPIYWGDPDIARTFNPKAIVNCHDFPSFDAVVKYVKYLDTHDDDYMTMLLAPPMAMGYRPFEHDMQKFILEIVAKGNHPRPKGIQYQYSNMAAWHLNLALDQINKFIIQPKSASIDESNQVIADLKHDPRNYSLIQRLSSIVKEKPDAMRELLYTRLNALCKNSTVPTPISWHRANVVLSAFESDSARPMESKVQWPQDVHLESLYLEMFNLVKPHDLGHKKKIRIGDDVYGFVMLDPEKKECVLSIDATGNMSCALAMAEKGFLVQRFAPRINGALPVHPNLTHHEITFADSQLQSLDKSTIESIIAWQANPGDKDAILHLNVGRGEWDFFEHVTEEQLANFSQILVQFHGLTNVKYLPRAMSVFRKISKTHVPVHFHYNNYPAPMAFQNFLVSWIWQCSFMRKNAGVFTPSTAIYPTILDRPTIANLPDIYIGRFEDILAAEAGQAVQPGRPAVSAILEQLTDAAKEGINMAAKALVDEKYYFSRW